jgi:hypothetical protein
MKLQTGLCLGFLLVAILGCGSAEYTADMAASKESYNYAPEATMADDSDSMAYQTATTSEKATGVVLKTVKADRKIIYTATVRVVVEDYASARKDLRKLAEDVAGIVQSSDEEVYSGENRQATFVYRIPVDKYEQFVQEVEKLGFHEGTTQNAQEVTAEYTDLQARIASQEKLEERVLKIVEERSGKIDEVLKAEQELARIRGEIERYQGRLNMLENQTALSTVTVELREERDYEPPTAPSFGDRIASSWTGSLDSLLKTGQNFVVGLVAATPWLVVLAILFGAFVLCLKLFVFRGRKRSASA